MVPRDSPATGPGSSASSVEARRVIAPVPMLELTAGSEDERILRIGHLVRRLELGCHQPAHAAGPRKALVEHHVATGDIGTVDRIGDVVLRQARSHVMLSSAGIIDAISVNTSPTCR